MIHTRHRQQLLRDCRGFGLIELMATVALVAILASVGLRSVDPRRHDISVSVRRISADFRWARSRAIVSGEHYRLHKTGDHTYQVERLEEVAGTWVLESIVREVELPEHIGLSTGDDDYFELDTRGVVQFDDPADVGPMTWTLTDSKFETARTLTLYPSGQLHADD